MLRVLLFLIPLILAVYALVDLVQTDDEQVRGLPKLVWVVLIVLTSPVGPLAWLIAGRKDRRGLLDRLAPRQAGPQPPRRPIAPDDDPDFLRGLGRSQPPQSPKPPKRSDDDEDDTTP